MTSLKSLLNTLSKEVKISVVVTDIVLTLYVLWLIITDTSHWLPGVIFGYTPFGIWLLYRANKLFGLCLLHRLMLMHSFLVYCCCIYQAYFGFGEWLYFFRWVMFITGALLLLQLGYKRCKCNKKGRE